MRLPDLPVFLTETRDLSHHIEALRSVRAGCQMAEIEAWVVLRTRLSEAQNHRCCWCGVRFSDTPHHPHAPSVEHVLPVSHEGGDDEANLAAACRRCNTRRGTRPVDAFLAHVLAIGWNEGRRPS